MPDKAFQNLVKTQLKQFKIPSISCINFVYELLISIIYEVDNKMFCELNKYPKLNEKVRKILEDLFIKFKNKTIEEVTKLISY